jgi:hypothetical protein
MMNSDGLISLTVPSFISAVESLLCKFGFILVMFLIVFVLRNNGRKAEVIG